MRWIGGIAVVAVIFGIILVLADLLRSPANIGAATNEMVYDIEAHVDSTDLLIIRGPALLWHHPQGGAAVGRHRGEAKPTIISASINGDPLIERHLWTPEWPKPLPDQIRFEAMSSVFYPLSPALPTNGIHSVQATKIAGRGSVTVTQFPNSSNDFTLVVKFTDGFSGSAALRAKITILTETKPFINQDTQ